MKRVLIYTILLVLCLIPVMTSDTFADGKYFPAKAYRTSPTIHSQRAILKYKDGVETLVIESSFDGEGKDFGWVIPLPNKPTKFEQASRGFLETLSQTIQPKIVHDRTRSYSLIFAFAGAVGMFFWASLFMKSKRELFQLLFIFALLSFFAIVLVPTLGKAKGFGLPSGTGGINVLDAQEVGSFGLVVLQADDAKALDQWLTENGFAGLNPKENQIVSDYIQEGWCFVAAKLKRDSEGYTEPHPLAMTFEVNKPVYPMRLTAAADSDVYLELFVIADNYASNPSMSVENAYRYSYNPDARRGLPGYGTIGHPDAGKYMWDKCVLTRLCEVLSPEDMKEDIVVQLKEGENFLKTYYSHKGAFDSGMIYGLIAWSCTIIAFTFLGGSKISWKFKIICILLPATCLLFVIWGGFYLVVEKVDVSQVKGGWIIEMLIYHDIEKGIANALDDAIFADCLTVVDVENKLQDKVFPAIIEEEKYIKNIKLEDSPGNVDVLEDDRGLVIRVFRRGGFYEDLVLSDKGV